MLTGLFHRGKKRNVKRRGQRVDLPLKSARLGFVVRALEPPERLGNIVL